MTSPTQSDLAVSSTSSPASQLGSLLQDAGVARLKGIGWIRVTGEDRVRWLNGMVTNSIQSLAPGEGNYNFFLSVQGRIQGDASIFAGPDDLLIETASSQLPGLIALLDRFIIMDDVELADVSGAITALFVAGPRAASLLRQIGLEFSDRESIFMQNAPWNGAEVRVIHAYGPLVPRYELWADDATATKMLEALEGAGGAIIEEQALEQLRILEGTPLYGTDIRDRELPQETAQARALHFAKGCYLGQEIVERIRSRGNVHRTFSGFRLEGELPAAGVLLEADGKQVGELTSAASIPLLKGAVQLGLGYIRREVLDRGLAIAYPGGIAVPVPLPFSNAAASEPQPASETSERV
jgi:folate-binding protein YgfZ